MAVKRYDGSAWQTVAGLGAQGAAGASGTAGLTTKGDLLVYGTSATRLPVGTNNYVLTADSAATEGVKWSPAAGFKGVFLYQSAGQSLSNATDTTITWDTEQYDTDAFHSTSSNTDRITIPTGLGGYYNFIIGFTFPANATGYREVYLNTSTGVFYMDLYQSTSSTNSRQMLTGSAIVNLSAGAYAQVQAYQNSGGSLTNTNGRGSSYFIAQYLGA